MNGYIGFYNEERVELYADTLYEAKLAALAHFAPPKRRAGEVHVALAEKNGEPVVHAAAD